MYNLTFALSFVLMHELHDCAVYPNLQDTGALHMQIMQRTKDTAEVRFICRCTRSTTQMGIERILWYFLLWPIINRLI